MMQSESKPKRVFKGNLYSGMYEATDESGEVIVRAYDGLGYWELQTPNGKVIDTDQFRADLAKRNNIDLIGWAD